MITILKITLLLLILVKLFAFNLPPRRLASLRLCSNENSPDNKNLIVREFSKLSPSGALTYEQFRQWDVTQALLDQEVFENETIFENLWADNIGDVNSTTCNLEQFLMLDEVISDLFDKAMSDTTNTDRFWPDNVWDPSYDPLVSRKPAYINELKSYFDTYAVNDKLSYNEYSNLDEIKNLLQSKELDIDVINDIWTEAFERTYITRIGIYNKTIIMYSLREKYSKYKDNSISFSTFVRLMMRIDVVRNELFEAHFLLSDHNKG